MNKKKKIGIISAAIVLICIIFLPFGENESTDTSKATFECTETFKETVSTSLSEEIISNESTKTTNRKNNDASEIKTESDKSEQGIKLNNIPRFNNKPFVAINNNRPSFNLTEKRPRYYETYSPLDYMGRCTLAEASLGVETMPRENRGQIGMIKPSGWHTVKYGCVNGKYLYNRCHLIGFQLSGENANERNLITGTRYLNIEGMLPFENMVTDYIKETENHVLYRAKPIFKGDEKVARGVQIEALSVEDKGEGICFNVYCYNNQPGIDIDYKTGESKLDENAIIESTSKNIKKPIKNNSTTISNDKTNEQVNEYIANKNSKVFHRPTCQSAKQMSNKNKIKYKCTKKELIKDGYRPCKRCKP